MSGCEFFYSEIPEEQIRLDPNEVAARLRTVRGYTDGLVEKCEKQVRSVLNCKYSAVRTQVAFLEDEKVDLGFGSIESKALCKNLSGCSEAFVFAVTLGHDVDRLLKRLSVVSLSEHFVADALASAFAEAACDYADSKIKGDLKCKPRFSPGYGDFLLAVQPRILASVDAGRLLNITLGETLMMSPVKSITAVMGIIK